MASSQRPLRWMPLDNAAKIYPAAKTKHWVNIFRQSVTLTEPVDSAVLQQALDVTVKRFPSIACRLRRGMFWYYLQEVPQAPSVRQETAYPLNRMSREELRQYAFRVIVYNRRIAVEFFHSLTDGNGALIFLKTLTAEYLRRKYAISIPNEHGVADLTEPPPLCGLVGLSPDCPAAVGRHADFPCDQPPRQRNHGAKVFHLIGSPVLPRQALFASTIPLCHCEPPQEAWQSQGSFDAVGTA